MNELQKEMVLVYHLVDNIEYNPKLRGVELIYFQIIFFGPQFKVLVGEYAGIGGLSSSSHQGSQTPGKNGPVYSPYWRLIHKTEKVHVIATVKNSSTIKYNLFLIFWWSFTN